MSNKPQIVYIHGGDAFADTAALYAMLEARRFNPYEPEQQKWRQELAAATAATHDFLAPVMPNKYWADYTAWKIWFLKIVPYLRDEVVLVGHSLGGGFLVRFLSEETLPVTVASCHLVAPVVTTLPLAVGGFHIEPATWAGFTTVPKALHLWHSTDDSIVPIAESETLVRLYPAAILHRFTDRFHFIGETFPELVAVVQERRRVSAASGSVVCISGPATVA